MSRTPHAARPASALVAALAVLAASWPLTPLFDAPTWGPTTTGIVLVSAATGVLARAGGLRPWAVILTQCLVAGLVVIRLFARSTLVGGLMPAPDTVQALRAAAGQGLDTLARTTVPVPTDAGLDLLVTSLLVAVAVTVDALAVTLRRAVVAGLPLAVPYLTAMANRDGALPPGQFIAVVTCWIILLATSAAPGRAESRRQPGRAAARHALEVTATAAVAAAAAVVIAAGTPHLATRSMGVGRGATASAVGFSPEADISRDLRSGDRTPVLHVRTNDPAPQPLRVTVSSSYVEGVWAAEKPATTPTDHPTLTFPAGATGALQSRTRDVTVTQNRLDAPYLASPAPVVRGTVTGARWAMSPDTGSLWVDRTPDTYTTTYLDVDAARDELLKARPVETATVDPADLDTSWVSERTGDLAESITTDARTPYEQALALQDWFRSRGGFTYSLDLADAPPGADNPRRDALDRFLDTKRGYCVQYATAMTLMARTLGIPARYATGFLPGERDGDGYDVVAADAHAWPELYFDTVGWVRFEPTPAARSGTAPAYAPDPSTSVGSPSTTPTTAPAVSASPSPSPSAAADAAPRRSDATTAGGAPPTQGDRSPWWAFALAVGTPVGAACVLPILATRRRRRLETAEHGDSEAAWTDLLADLADLGVTMPAHLPPGAQAENVGTRLPLDDATARCLRRLAHTVQNTRYAPGPAPAWSVADARCVRRAVASSRPWPTRMRAAWWPTLGRRELARCFGRR